MNFLQKKLWLALSKFRFLRLPVERRVRLEVTTDGRHITFLLVSLYEAGYGVQVFGRDWFFRELMLLRKSAPIPFLYGGKEIECGISISDQPSTLDAGRSSLFVLDYDYFSGLTTKSTKEHEIGKIIETTADIEVAAGMLLASQARASESDSVVASKLAHSLVSESLIRSADGPTSPPATSHSLPATAPEALRMPYFMQPGALHEGFHKFASKNPGSSRAIRLGFYGTHHPLYYTKHFRFPILPRTPILERFVEVFSEQFQRIDGDNLYEIQARIAVSFDYSQSDQVKKSYLKKADYFAALEKTDFMLCPPGWCMPQAHNLVESMSRGVIPILNYPEYMVPKLEDGVQCLSFSNLEEMERRVREALEMPQERIIEIRANVLLYYKKFLAPGSWWGQILRNSGKKDTILVNHEADSVARRDSDFLVAAAEFIGRFPEK
jgi:hypothetical protein